MAAPEIAVLLRECGHDSATGSKIRYALKCDNISISYAKTPIQIPLPKLSPQLIDIGVYRPSVSLSGVIDAVGGDLGNTTAGFEGMESISYVRTTGTGGHADARTYYVPYKNHLENFVTNYTFSSNANPLEIEWGDASFPVNVSYTAGTASQSTDTITGSGTTWTDAMVGREFSFDSTTSGGGKIAVRNSDTEIEVDTSATVVSGTYKIDSYSTGGAVYQCAIQQCRFQVDASKEDRYTFSMQLVVSKRQDS